MQKTLKKLSHVLKISKLRAKTAAAIETAVGVGVCKRLT